MPEEEQSSWARRSGRSSRTRSTWSAWSVWPLLCAVSGSSRTTWATSRRPVQQPGRQDPGTSRPPTFYFKVAGSDGYDRAGFPNLAETGRARRRSRRPVSGHLPKRALARCGRPVSSRAWVATVWVLWASPAAASSWRLRRPMPLQVNGAVLTDLGRCARSTRTGAARWWPRSDIGRAVDLGDRRRRQPVRDRPDAARLAVEAMLGPGWDTKDDRPWPPADDLGRHGEPDPLGAGTRYGRVVGPHAATVVAAVIRGETAWIVSASDCRAYMIRPGAIRQITRDHTLAAEEVRQGRLRLEDVARHPGRNTITRCLGPARDGPAGPCSRRRSRPGPGCCSARTGSPATSRTTRS